MGMGGVWTDGGLLANVKNLLVGAMRFLDAELNLDARDQSNPEQIIPKSSRPSVLSRLKTPTSRESSPKQKKHHEEVR